MTTFSLAIGKSMKRNFLPCHKGFCILLIYCHFFPPVPLPWHSLFSGFFLKFDSQFWITYSLKHCELLRKVRERRDWPFWEFWPPESFHWRRIERYKVKSAFFRQHSLHSKNLPHYYLIYFISVNCRYVEMFTEGCSSPLIKIRLPKILTSKQWKKKWKVILWKWKSYFSALLWVQNALIIYQLYNRSSNKKGLFDFFKDFFDFCCRSRENFLERKWKNNVPLQFSQYLSHQKFCFLRFDRNRTSTRRSSKPESIF